VNPALWADITRDLDAATRYAETAVRHRWKFTPTPFFPKGQVVNCRSGKAKRHPTSRRVAVGCRFALPDLRAIADHRALKTRIDRRLM
jgi:hypothetical protein